MKFQEMTYERPEMDTAANRLRELIATFSDASSASEQEQIIVQINSIRSHVQTMYSLCYIRNTVDTQDEFYREEKLYFDQVLPELEGVETEYYRALIGSPFRSELEARFGAQLFRIAELSTKTFAPEIMADLQENNRLSTEYSALVASAQIPFDGQMLNLSQLGKYLNSPDRETREAAHEAKYAFFSSHEEKLDEIYDQLVKARTNMGTKLGYQNFTELGYARLSRTDYNADKVATFRNQVHSLIVPLAEKLKERQRLRIGVDTLRYFDEGFNFRSGNPAPKGDPDWILDRGRQMYRELSPDTDEFFSFMMDNELMDVLSKKGKRVGGYCTVIPDAKAPYIFANFNSTAHDVEVLTHEAGHAFMAYSARELTVPEYEFPTLEAAEIHSMSMEFFTWDWMKLFFQEDTEKFKFYHLSSAITIIPYLVTVDEFQHYVYDHPEASPAERKAAWRTIEQKYMPHRDYEGNDYLQGGSYWHQQQHIFARPFYYIDYALAQICALQFWKRMQDDRQAAWEDYLHLCTLAGSKSFLELVAEANLISPFEDGCIDSIISDIGTWLDKVDDQAL